MSAVKICDMNGGAAGTFEVSDELLVLEKGAQAVKDAVIAYRAGQRKGTASTLRKGEVNGSGVKPWRQKGTGRARSGYRQSPVWRGGGVAFGPQPRSYRKKLSRKAARLAFARALSDKIAGGGLVVLDRLELSEAKTKVFASTLRALEIGGPALVVIDKSDRNIVLASRNLPRVEVATAARVNTYQLVRYPVAVVTRAAMELLVDRIRDQGRVAS